MHCEVDASDDEAEDIEDQENRDDEIVVEEYGQLMKSLLWVELFSKKTVEISHVRQRLITTPKLIHQNSDQC